MCEYIWVCKGLQGVCMDMYGMHGYIWVFRDMYVPVCICRGIHGVYRVCMIHGICMGYVRVCWDVLGYAGMGRDMLEFVGICMDMYAYVWRFRHFELCRDVQGYVGMCKNMNGCMWICRDLHGVV